MFDPVRQGDAGTYLCRARNEVGASDELSVTFDVLFEPRNLRTAPARREQLEAGDRARFECFADANPPADFEWLQKVAEEEEEEGGGGREDFKTYSRSKSRVVEFRNVSYENEGVWVCVARNTIKGQDGS